MTRVRDPKGAELFPTLLHVEATDDRGRPTSCRVRYDDEQIDLSEDTTQNQFLLVWAPASCQLDPTALGSITALRREAHEVREMLADTKNEIRFVTDEIERLQKDNTQKTEALRELQRERDPERIERTIAERVRSVTADLEVQLVEAKRTIANRDSAITELQASKRRLRDALDRLKSK